MKLPNLETNPLVTKQLTQSWNKSSNNKAIDSILKQSELTANCSRDVVGCNGDESNTSSTKRIRSLSFSSVFGRTLMQIEK